MSTSYIDAAVEAVMDMIDGLGLFADIKRGALGTGDYLACQIGPSSPDEVYLDKARYIPIDLTINGKHENQARLSEDMNLIHEQLTSCFAYPGGDGWRVVDITTTTLPQIIGREADNRWIMASSLGVKLYLERKDG